MGNRAPRTFLFLQGPHGSYFSRLADALRDKGHRALRININGGDKVDWPGEGATDYRGTFRNWPLFFDDFIVNNGVTDLILYGDCRPYHASAHNMARLRDLRVHVMEEGYIRPDFLTLQADGVNGNSTLPLDPDWYREQAKALPALDESQPAIPSTFRARAHNTMRNGLSAAIMRPLFPFYRTHRPHSFVLESAAWFVKLTRKTNDKQQSAQTWAQVKDKPFFALPLQLNSDYQIRVHSPFGNMRAALRFAIKSFAQHAPEGVSLVIKRHPLDPAMVSWERLIKRLAARYSVKGRIFYLADWDIGDIVQRSLGVVTVNSTVGTLALNCGRPVIVMGHAVYKIPGVVHRGSLDSFWSNPQAPDMALYADFKRVLMDKCLIRGGLLSEQGLQMLIDNSVERLLRDLPATPQRGRGKPELGLIEGGRPWKSRASRWS